MANTQTQTNPWWGSANFYIALAMGTIGLWLGFSEKEVNSVAGAAIGLFGFIFAIRERIKNTSINWRAWALSKNTWNYLFAALTAIVPSLPLGLGERVSEVLQAFAGKNWAGVITGFVSIATILWVWLQGGRVSVVKTSA